MNLYEADTRQIIFTIHTLVSAFVAILIIYSFFRNYKCRIKDVKYSKCDKKISLYTIILLYAQLILGIYLFFIKKTNEISESVDIERIIKNNYFRFWSVEHFILMIFALVIAQIAYIIINNTNDNNQKLKIQSKFNLIISFLVILSMAFAILKT